jgi:hypothetical protein
MSDKVDELCISCEGYDRIERCGLR